MHFICMPYVYSLHDVHAPLHTLCPSVLCLIPTPYVPYTHPWDSDWLWAPPQPIKLLALTHRYPLKGSDWFPSQPIKLLAFNALPRRILIG